MAATPKEKEVTTTGAAKKKRSWLGKIGTFLMMGGWILIMIIAVGIYIAITALTK